MNNLILGYFQLLIFGCFVILVLRFERRYFKFYPGVKTCLALGFFLLFSGAFSAYFLPLIDLPFKLDSNLKAGIETGLYLLGGMIMLYGLRSWFSHLARAKKVSVRRLKELTCLKQLHSLSQNEQDLDRDLKEGFSRVMRFMGYEKGVLYRSTFDSPEMLLLSHFNLTPEELQRFYALNLDEGYYNEAIKTREIIAINQYQGTTEWEKLFPNEDKVSSFACVPFKHAHKVFGIICIYDSEPERFAFEEVQFLTSLRDSFGLMVEQSQLTQKFRARKRSLQTADLMTRIFLETKDLEEDFPSLAQNLRKVQDFDYISLSLVEGAGKNVRKLSLGLGENLLLDKNVNLPVYGTSIGWVIDSGEPMIENDLPAKGYYEDNLSKLLGIRCMMILPLKIKEKVIGTLSLGSKKTHSFNENSARKLSLFSSLFSFYLQKKKLKESLKQENEYFQTFHTHLSEFLRSRDLKGYLNSLTEELTQVLPVSFCRISFLDSQKKNLQLFSGYKRREEICFPAGGSQSLEALPWHRLTLESKKPMLINQDDPESTISKEESSLFLAPNVKSALLLPLVQNGDSFGIVALGEMRSWERRPFRKKEVDFLEKIGQQISFAHQETFSRGLSEKYPSSNLDQKISHLGLEVNNSLTSIIGSLELLNLKKNLSEDKSERYLKIIEKGALRIKENMEIFFNQTEPESAKK